MSNIDTVVPKMNMSLHEPRSRHVATQEDVSGKQSETLSPAVCLYAPPKRSRLSLYFYLGLATVLFMGWHYRHAEFLTPESGLGYNIGIAGSAMMLLLLLYPLRKKIRFMGRWGKIKYWFKIHMILGMLGPVLILFHAKFQTGSMNSIVVLISMLLVASSGFVGRYVYTKIHYGLYGKRMSLKSLQKNMDISRSSLVVALCYAPKMKQRLMKFETAVLMPHHGVLRSIWYVLITTFLASWTHIILLFNLRRVLKITAKRAGWSIYEQREHGKAARRHIATHITTIKKISYFGFYERLFALWHLFHMPLFFLLVITAVVHVLAVHMY
jgi:hypothetical protein